MSNQNPISPVTGKPSALTAMIRRSTGIPDGTPSPVQAQPQIDQDLIMRQKLAPGVYPIETPRLRQQVRRGMGLDQPQQQAQQQQAQVQKAGVTADEIGAAIGEAVGRLLTPVLRQLERTLDQANAQQQQQAMVQQAAYETPTSFVARSAVQPGVSQTLPLPPTGPGTVSGGQTVVITHAPTNPGTAANAMLNEMRYGPMPTPTPMVQRAYVDSRLPISPVTKQPSLLTAQIRAGMGLPY